MPKTHHTLALIAFALLCANGGSKAISDEIIIGPLTGLHSGLPNDHDFSSLPLSATDVVVKIDCIADLGCTATD